MITLKDRISEDQDGVLEEGKSSEIKAQLKNNSIESVPLILPNPEVSEKAVRRSHTTEYKLRILQKADACVEPGSLGALLRREGLYSSHLTIWRRQREQGILSALTAKKRGRKEPVSDQLLIENRKLRKENEQLANRLRQAEIIIDVQKKISNLLGIPLTTPEEGGKA